MFLRRKFRGFKVNKEENVTMISKRRLDHYAQMQRSSLRLVIQDDMVFIMSYYAHRPKNVIEGHGMMMTKGK